MNVLELFAGIGNMGLGLERAGMRVVGQVEIDDFCRRVLARHWPEVPRHDDVRTAVEWWRAELRPRVHVVAGGFPCQPVSLAGQGLGQADERWLWPAMAVVIEELRPDWVVWENVPGLRTRGLGAVLADLDRLRYVCRVGEISACAMGAPHARRRLFGLAPEGHGWREGWPGGPVGQGAHRGDEQAQGVGRQAGHTRPAGDGWWRIEPPMARVAHGIPRRVDRSRALGNAVVPQVSEYIGRLILSTEGRAA